MESHHFHWWNGGIPSDPKQIKSNTIAIGSQVQGGQVQMHWLVHHYLIPCHGLWRALVVEQGSVAPHQADGQPLEEPAGCGALLLPSVPCQGTAQFLGSSEFIN